MQVTGDLPQALRSAERALELDPRSGNDRLYLVAAQVMLDSGRSSDAVRVAREALAGFGLTNQSVAIRIVLARALVARGQSIEALTELDIALSIQPGYAAAQQLKAQIQGAIPK
jgi:tetratricopeptide (TPR) repeat protein